VIYQLPNGKVIEISVEAFLDMSDDELNNLIAYNYGEEVQNPFFGSALDGKNMIIEDEDTELELPDIPISERIFDENFKREDVEE
jgi:hypothetical protein